MGDDETREGSVVLRENGQVVGVTRGRKKKVERRSRFSTTLQADPITKETVRKTAESLITSTPNMLTEDQANVRALELISDAATSMEKRFRIRTRQSKSRTWLTDLADKLAKKNSNG